VAFNWDSGKNWDAGGLWGPVSGGGTTPTEVTGGGQWSVWLPTQGPLGIELSNGYAINALWFPYPLPPITVSANNAGMYTVSTTGSEVVRVNASTTFVTLTGTSSVLTYVYATSDRFRPYKEGT
jgi:hypothetical protein